MRAVYVYVVCLDSLFWGVAGVVVTFFGRGRTVWLDFLPLSLLSRAFASKYSVDDLFTNCHLACS